MCNVTTRIKTIKQPSGGYIKPSEFEIIELNDGKQLNSDENVHASIIGMTVDYLTRIVNGANPVEVFNTPLEGAVLAETLGNKNSIKVATKLLKHIKGLDKKSIINACKLVTFSVWAFNPAEAAFAKSYKEIKPDESTIFNIQV